MGLVHYYLAPKTVFYLKYHSTTSSEGNSIRGEGWGVEKEDVTVLSVISTGQSGSASCKKSNSCNTV